VGRDRAEGVAEGASPLALASFSGSKALNDASQVLEVQGWGVWRWRQACTVLRSAPNGWSAVYSCRVAHGSAYFPDLPSTIPLHTHAHILGVHTHFMQILHPATHQSLTCTHVRVRTHEYVNCNTRTRLCGKCSGQPKKQGKLEAHTAPVPRQGQYAFTIQV
jgi:hypothetical protein